MISISTLLKLFTMVLYWSKPIQITHYLCILSLLIILILSIFDIYQDAYFNLSSLFIKFFHMCVLSDVLSASIVCVAFMEVALSFTLFSTEINEIMNMILSYKSYLAFLYIHISEYVRTMFLTYLSIFFSIWRYICKCEIIVYKVFVYIFLTWCSICCHCIFHVSIICTIFQCDTCWGWWS